jgi:hypothetical protein
MHAPPSSPPPCAHSEPPSMTSSQWLEAADESLLRLLVAAGEASIGFLKHPSPFFLRSHWFPDPRSLEHSRSSDLSPYAAISSLVPPLAADHSSPTIHHRTYSHRSIIPLWEILIAAICYILCGSDLKLDSKNLSHLSQIQRSRLKPNLPLHVV